MQILTLTEEAVMKKNNKKDTKKTPELKDYRKYGSKMRDIDEANLQMSLKDEAR